MDNRKIRVVATTVMLATLAACGGGSRQPKAQFLQSLSISASSPSIALGRTVQFKATGNYSDGSSQELTTSVAWTSSQTGVATINSSSGLATSVATGTSTITATSGTVTGTATLTIGPAELVSLALSSSSAVVSLGQSVQFNATGKFTDNSQKDVTSSVTWSSDSTVATVSASGNAVGRIAGAATINAASNSISGSATLTVTAPKPGFLFAADGTNIAVFDINAATGQLSNERLSAVSGDVCALSSSPDGNFIYAVLGSSSISSISSPSLAAFQVDPAGLLTSIASYSFPSAMEPVVRVTPDGKYLYVTDFIAFQIYGFARDVNTGKLTALSGSPTKIGPAPTTFDISPNGKFLYAAIQGGDQIEILSIGSDGTLTQVLPPAVTGSHPMSVLVDSTNSFAYATNDFSANIYSYVVDSTKGTLQLVGSPIPVGDPRGLAIDPSGRFVFVANVGGGLIYPLRIDLQTGALSEGTAVASGITSPYGMVVDPSGRFLYAQNAFATNDLAVFVIDVNTGSLTLVQTIPRSARVLLVSGIAVSTGR